MITALQIFFLTFVSSIFFRVLSKSAAEVTSNLDYVYKAVEETCIRLENRVPLIGFASAPWTLMCYMIDGSGQEKTKEKFGIARKWLYDHPDAANDFLSCLADHVANHLINQAKSGCHILQLFDSWAGLIPPAQYRKFCIPSLLKIATAVKKACPDTPIILFAKGANGVLEDLSLLPFDVLSVDSFIELSDARKRVCGRVGIQGNMDPSALQSSPAAIKDAVREMLESYGSQRHYIANLGHGCLPSYTPENVGVFIDAVHDISRQMIAEENAQEFVEIEYGFGTHKVLVATTKDLKEVNWD